MKNMQFYYVNPSEPGVNIISWDVPTPPRVAAGLRAPARTLFDRQNILALMVDEC